jgi:uncharacterized protein
VTEAIGKPPTLAALRARREDILRIAARHGASNVRVVGSVARGEATATSDVDLLVRVPRPCSIFELVDLWLDLRECVGNEVSIIPDDNLALDNEFRESVLRDAVEL